MATNFFSRWSERKRAAIEEQESLPTQETPEQCSRGAHCIAPDAMNAESERIEPKHAESTRLESSSTAADGEKELENKSENTPISALLASNADEAVKKAALRKLFHSEEFNVVDRLNDYDHDYKSSIGALAPNVAQTLREWMKPVEEALTEVEPGSATCTSDGSVAVDNNESIEANSDTLTQSETQALTSSPSDLPPNETRDETKDPT
ncbi:DUF3306 domain-containing protein [Vibrio vulnificus]|uniref:DUF3306 domain-containing protein n=1 Tax=Vibrio vulnificus TaxID=672 RepID=UPI0002D2CEFA|nr:DUF3306 domain-containing protein [Vibrio vulnificus]ASM97669.1 hypothetical protein AOT11_21480 [Vibrio vulnificus NBRC 15645 = ATCC 27562]EGQ7983548.1 DUF3306 domain-containing protein [Vibrio vulnificus]EGQ9993051.1 DUF3306 domain-containing protein [Vibrio vulnificus]EIO3970916.1 DUF3306 domain-containing protein [Vibrio vulnificus]EIV8467419.1 DUF3306 domain-containing protein [Vibrio vulnificus]